jgi:hypothetical protein
MKPLYQRVGDYFRIARHLFRSCFSPQQKALMNAYPIALDPNPLAGDEGPRLVVESCIKHERMICVSKRLLPSSCLSHLPSASARTHNSLISPRGPPLHGMTIL